MPVAEARTSETTNFVRNARAGAAEVCVVHAGALFAGVPIAHIAEIVGAVRLQPLPHAPWFVGGLVLYRGEVLTAVDLRRLLDVGSDSPGPALLGSSRSMLVIDCADARSAGGAFGLLVDCVDEVLSISSDDYEPNPPTLDARHRELLDGAYKLEGRLLVMLNSERLDPVYLASTRHSSAGESIPARPVEGER
jgi:purine-binding chemotaxis protein CheW